VDRVLDARQLVETFGPMAFDIVITTEMVEHVRDWPQVISNLKGVLRPGGHLLVTTRSKGFPYHGWPYDFWRYEADDMRQIFGDLELIAVEADTASPGIFVFARRPESFQEETPDLALYSIVTGRRQRRVTDAQIVWYRVTSALHLSVAEIGRRWDVGWRRLRGVRPMASFRRVIGSVWRALPARVRSDIKAVLRRAEARR
jgi:SAM-dependent methyltransferase